MKTLYRIFKCICVLIILNVLVPGCGSGNQGKVNASENEKKSNHSVIFSEVEQNALNAITSDNLFGFLGKTFDKSYADQQYEKEKANSERNQNLQWDEEYEGFFSVFRLMLNENLYNRLLFSDSFAMNLKSLEDEGLLAIIPRNPYSGNDIKTILAYSPGDCFLAADDRGVIYIYHCGPKDDEYDPSRKNHDVLTYQKNDNQSEFLSDGRSLIHYHKFNPQEYSQLLESIDEARNGYYGDYHPQEFVKINWLHRQVFEMLLRYSETHEKVLTTLDDYINYFGRKNPAAWVNPYTKKSMQIVSFPANCIYSPTRNLPPKSNAPVPKDLLEYNENSTKYVGNYSFANFKDSQGPLAVFAIYYLDANDRLCALTCTATTKTRFLRELQGETGE